MSKTSRVASHTRSLRGLNHAHSAAIAAQPGGRSVAHAHTRRASLLSSHLVSLVLRPGLSLQRSAHIPVIGLMPVNTGWPHGRHLALMCLQHGQFRLFREL